MGQKLKLLGQAPQLQQILIIWEITKNWHWLLHERKLAVRFKDGNFLSVLCNTRQLLTKVFVSSGGTSAGAAPIMRLRVEQSPIAANFPLTISFSFQRGSPPTAPCETRTSTNRSWERRSDRRWSRISKWKLNSTTSWSSGYIISTNLSGIIILNSSKIKKNHKCEQQRSACNYCYIISTSSLLFKVWEPSFLYVDCADNFLIVSS